MLDKDWSCTMSFPEFKELWAALEAWKRNFQQNDQDRSGSIEARELDGAIKSLGYNLQPMTVGMLTKRYAKRATGQITFDDFVGLCVRLRGVSEQFRRRDTTGQGYAQLKYEDFIQICLMN